MHLALRLSAISRAAFVRSSCFCRCNAVSTQHRLYMSNSTQGHDGTSEPQIPVYSKTNESVETKRARLVYQSRKRGTLENGLLLGTFASSHLNKFTSQQLDEYDTLINRPSNDWDIYHWMTGIKDVPDEYNSGVMKLLKEHVKNKNKESRIIQPDLE